MPPCCLCGNTTPENRHDYVTISFQRRTLVKCLLKLAGVETRNCSVECEIVCNKCEKDLINLENFVIRITEGHQNNLLVFPMQQTSITSTGCCGQSDILECNDSAPLPVEQYPSTISNSKSCDAQISNKSLPKKRFRRPPKRYHDEQTSADKNYMSIPKNIKISTYHKNVQSSFLSLQPKMAQLRTSNGIIIGDLVELQRRGKHSRLRILCRKCPEAFTQERYFRQHLSKHMQCKEDQTLLNETYPFDQAVKFLYLCTLCEKGFRDHSIVRRHFKTCHNEDRPFQCEMCPADFKYKTNLNYHTAKHLTHKNHQCPQCPKKFVLRYELQIHLRIHTGEKPFKCQICCLAFAHRSNLQKHRQAHRGHANSMTECHKFKTLSKSRSYLKKHERIREICNRQRADSNKLHTDTKDRNLLDIHEMPKSVDNNLLSIECMENTTNFEEFPKLSSPQIIRNFMPQSVGIPTSFCREATETHCSSDIEEASNSLSYSHLQQTNSNLENSSTCHSSISPLIADGQFVQTTTNSDTSSFNTASVDFVQTCQKSNIQWTNNRTTNIKPINYVSIKIMPNNLNTIKTNNSKLQDYSTKSNSIDVTSLHTVLNNKHGISSDDYTISLMDKQTKMRTTTLNDAKSYLPSQYDNKFIKIPMSSYGNCSAVQNISRDKILANFKIVSLADLPSLQMAANNVVPSCNNNIPYSDSILKISKYNKINRNNASKNIKLKSDCDNEINKELEIWNHVKNSPHKSSFLKSFEIPNFSITNSEPNYKITCKKSELLEKCDATKQIWRNAEKPLKNTICNDNNIESSTFTSLKNNKPLVGDSGDSAYTNTFAVTRHSSTAVQKTPLKLKISPNSLLKSQIQLCPTRTLKVESPPRSKPLITNIEILPQLNLESIQSPLHANEGNLQPTELHVLNTPKECKFQCSVCWKYFKLKSALTKHLRTHTGEKPYKCNVCPKSYADASNYKKHKILHIKAADALNIARPKPPPSPTVSNVTDPDPDGIEVMQTIQPFELSSGDSDDDMESYILQDAFQHSLMNQEMRENIRRNLEAINSAIMPTGEDVNISGRSLKRIFSPNCFASKNPKQ